jgi:hypothetical protein
MLTSITPLGERSRGNRWPVTTTAYALGCALGGATTGAVLGAVGAAGAAVGGAALPAPTVLVLAGLVCLAAAVTDLVPGTLPVGRRQVDERWLGHYRGWVYGAGFGYQLGLGVVTIVTSASTFAVLALALLTQSVGAGLLVGAVFGAARALPALLLRRVRTWDDVRSLGAGLDAHATSASRLTAAALTAGGAVLLVGGVL